MAETPRLKLPLLAASQAQKHVTHNEALLLLDLLVGIIPVLSRALTAPPAADDGAVYILAGAGSGAWSAFGGGDLALRIDGSWRRVLPSAGMVASISAESGTQIYWTGAAWAAVGAARALILKPTIQHKTNDIAMAADSALKFAMKANTSYSIGIKLYFTAVVGAGFKYAFTGPAAPTSVLSERRSRAPGATVQVTAGEVAYIAALSVAGHASSHGAVFFDIVVQNGPNAGQFAVEWAQVAAFATATSLRAGSSLEWAVIP